MRRSDFEFELPPELIAQTPLAQRSASRLLVVDGRGAAWLDRTFCALPSLLKAGDLLVFNDTKVLPARLAAQRTSGGRVEVLLERPLADRGALVQTRASNPLRTGEVLLSAGGSLQLLGRRGNLWEVALPEAAVAFFERYGTVPLPPYITRPPDAADRERYQSLWARVPGAVAAPTASLHFDAEILRALAALGIAQTFITLHVGAGTFQPVRDEQLDRHILHAESYTVPDAAAVAVARTRAAGGRIIAVGTTVARALESAVAEGAIALEDAGSPARRLPRACSGETTLFIRPGYEFQVVDGLITNFHLPGSTLLMLVAAFGGHGTLMAAYRHAIGQRYRFFSYGDAMLIWPAPAVCA